MAGFINGKTNYKEWRDHTKDTRAHLARVSLIEGGITTPSDEYRLVGAIRVSEMSGKLEGYYSVSTSVLMNPNCQVRAQIPGSICEKCYAASVASRYSQLTQTLETNYQILNGFLISEEAWASLQFPTTNGDARIESFGDVATVVCARNYLRIIRSHPHLTFGVWTKNVSIWNFALEFDGGKPSNMKYIVSSFRVNEPEQLDEETLKYADHRFTVYTKEYAVENGICINCGGKKCATCRNCYGDGPFDINELLK